MLYSKRMRKVLIVKICLSVAAIILGNIFWILFANSLQGEHILTNSPPHIILSFVYPIVLFGLYLSTIIFFSFFEKSKILWFVVVISSFISYVSILGPQAETVIGEILVSLAIFIFLLGFHRTEVLINNKSSIIARSSLALTGSTLIISIVIAVNFYNFYRKTLNTNNLLLSNRTIVKNLSPLIRIYLSDLQIKNLDETFGAYVKRIAQETHTNQTTARLTALGKLNLKDVDDTKNMRYVITQSLNDSILKGFSEYKKQIPILISLGLGIITQTLMTVSSVLSYGVTYLLYKLLNHFKLIHLKRREIVIDEVEIPNR